MRRQVWKYPVRPQVEPQAVKMPKGAEIIHVGQQRGEPYVWVMVHPHVMAEPRNIWCIGTGWDIDMRGKVYRGTAHCGAFVWHVFEEAP